MRVLALDVGGRRVGVAISDPTGTLARPLQAVFRDAQGRDLDAIAALVEAHDAGLVIVGRPVSLDGTEGPQAQATARYAERLAARLSVPVRFCDERFTTTEAEEILRLSRGREKRQRARASGELDAVAAAVILQRYLDGQ
jgi:putative Holliday junction resolvase